MWRSFLEERSYWEPQISYHLGGCCLLLLGSLAFINLAGHLVYIAMTAFISKDFEPGCKHFVTRIGKMALFSQGCSA